MIRRRYSLSFLGRFLRAILLAWLLLDPSLVHAEGGSITSFITTGGRTRVVQICVVCMILGLFILMRKWTEDGPRSPDTRRSPDQPQ